tara:strand:- start:26 stop:1531 length:1506 start_codon:yes stop_codon:yes gene_type:complete
MRNGNNKGLKEMSKKENKFTLDTVFVKNPNILYEGWLPISGFEELFLNGGIKRYDKFNRKKVWKAKDIEALRESIYIGDLYNPMVVVPIKDSIDLAVVNGDTADEAFFRGAYEDGKNQWLTLIGGNRGESIQVMITKFDTEHNLAFKKLLVPMIVTKALSREDIHRKFGADLRGVVPNAQEARNSIWNGDDCESEWVRKMSVKYSDMILAKNGLNRDTQRMMDDEFVASLCAFTRHRSLGAPTGFSSRDDVIDSIYKENTISSERKLTVDMLDYLQRVWKHMPDSNSGKAYWQALTVLGGIIQDDTLTWFGRTSPKKFIEEFAAWWLVNIEDEETDYRPSGKPVKFGTMVGGFQRKTHIKVLRGLLDTFVTKMLKMKVLKVDRSEDLATPEQRRKLLVERKKGVKVWVRQNGSVEGEMFDDNLTEFRLVSLTKLDDKVSYPTDHIIPKDVDFIDELSNMEITTQAYNSWKRKRIPDYKKITIPNTIDKKINIKKTLTGMAI